MILHLSKKRKRDPLSNAFTILVILNLAFYQLYPLSVSIADDTVESASAEASDEAKKSTSDETEEEEKAEEESTEKDDSGSEESGTETEDNEEEVTSTETSDEATEALTENEPSQDSSQQTENRTENTATAPSTTIDELSEQENLTQQQEPLWKSCSLDEQQESLMEAESCQECVQKTTCEEVEICLRAKIENDNTANIENNAAATSDTGNNTVAENETAENGAEQAPAEAMDEGIPASAEATDEATDETSNENGSAIDTGTAVAENILVNDVNTNIATENGERDVQEITNYVGDINLLELFLAILKNYPMGDEKTTAAIEIFNRNYAQIENIATSQANSGANTMNSDGSITTGDAIASNDIVNIANQNIVGNNWLLSVVNIFGTWIGDLIVPGEGLLELPSGATYANLDVTNENMADIENNATAQSDTGNNEIVAGPESSEPSAAVETGSAYSNNSVTTIANTNIVKNNWFLLIINNMGSWMGNVFGYDSASGKVGSAFSFDFASLLGNEDNVPSGSLTVHNENYANINNTALASATTGTNEISGTGRITTGDAYSQNSILNFVNSNFVGDNWLFAMVNVFGEWDGDVVFAYPDLQISVDDGKSEIYPDENLTYHIVVTNIGKAAASDAQVSFDAPSGVSSSSNQSSWDIPTLEPGSSQEFAVEAKSTSVSPLAPSLMTASAQVSTKTEEKEKTNNSAQDETTLIPDTPHATITEIADSGDDFDTKLSISRTTSSSGSVVPGELVKHSIIVKNKSNVPLYGVVLEDEVSDATGNKLGTYRWQLGDMDTDDALLVEYESITNASASSIALQYEASAKGEDPSENEVESRSVSLFLTFFGAAAYAADNNFPGATNNETILDNPLQEAVLGEMQEKNFRLPLWIWILAAIAYFLALNWSLFPNKKQLSGFRH